MHPFPARLHRQPTCKTLKTPIFISEKKYLRGLLIVTTLASFVGCFVLVVRGVWGSAIMNVRDIRQKKGNGR